MTRRRYVWGAGLVLPWLLWAGGCDEEGEFVAEPRDDIGQICAFQEECTSGCLYGLRYMAPYCTRSCADAPCPAGYYCVGRAGLGMVCAMGECASDGDCPVDYLCNTDRQVCQHVDLPCGGDADCPTGTACNQGACATVCSDDADCKQGYHCNVHITTCMACAHHAHCADGFACAQGVCGQACIDSNDCRPGYQCVDHGCDPIEAGGPGTLGSDCDEDAQCEHFCLHHRCTQLCDVPNDPDQCPEGFYCEQFSMVCQPQG